MPFTRPLQASVAHLPINLQRSDGEYQHPLLQATAHAFDANRYFCSFIPHIFLSHVHTICPCLCRTQLHCGLDFHHSSARFPPPIAPGAGPGLWDTLALSKVSRPKCMRRQRQVPSYEKAKPWIRFFDRHWSPTACVSPSSQVHQLQKTARARHNKPLVNKQIGFSSVEWCPPTLLAREYYPGFARHCRIVLDALGIGAAIAKIIAKPRSAIAQGIALESVVRQFLHQFLRIVQHIAAVRPFRPNSVALPSSPVLRVGWLPWALQPAYIIMSASPPEKNAAEQGDATPDNNSESMDRGEEVQAREAYDFEVKEQDRWLPIANGWLHANFSCSILVEWFARFRLATAA